MSLRVFEFRQKSTYFCRCSWEEFSGSHRLIAKIKKPPSCSSPMPLKFDWKSHLFSQSCVDLSSTRTRNRSRRGNGDSETVVAVSFRGSQLALAKETVDHSPPSASYSASSSSSFSNGSGKRKGRERERERRSLPPEDCLVEMASSISPPRQKPDRKSVV